MSQAWLCLCTWTLMAGILQKQDVFTAAGMACRLHTLPLPTPATAMLRQTFLDVQHHLTGCLADWSARSCRQMTS